MFAIIFVRGIGVSVWVAIGMYVILLFVCCMSCHGELARLRPYPRYLTAFYLTISIVGALGGIAINLIAPYLFKAYWELPIGLLACAILLFVLLLFNRQPGQTVRATSQLFLPGRLYYSVVSSFST